MNLDAINKSTKGKVKTTGVSPFQELDISKVYANPNQPRKNFEDIEELAASIKEHGLIQPIAVVSDGRGLFMIVAGERRFRASETIGSKTIKAHILQAESKKIEEISLIENIQRSGLTDLEIAKFISQLWNSGQYKKKADLAAAIGKSASYISKAFSCLKLCDEIIKDIEENKNDLSLSVLEEMARVKDKDTQIEVYEKYVAGDIVRNDIKDFKPMVENKTNKKETEKEISQGKKLTFQYTNDIEEKKLLAVLKLQIGSITEAAYENISNYDLEQQTKYKITIEEI